MNKLDHAKIIAMLNQRKTVQEIVDAVNPGKKRQTMDEYIKRNFECTVKWKERKAAKPVDKKEIDKIKKEKESGLKNKMQQSTKEGKK